MLGINDLKNGSSIVLDNEPFVVLEIKHQHLGRGGASVKTEVKNLRTGQVFERNFKSSDKFEEMDMEKIKGRFVYSHRGAYWFTVEGGERFSLSEENISGMAGYLKPELEITVLKFKDKIVNIELPIKVDYKVKEAPPAIRGDTVQGGTKPVVIESGARVLAPLFVKEGDVIRVNTQTGEYVERAEKFNQR